jgi:hypothetical protein
VRPRGQGAGANRGQRERKHATARSTASRCGVDSSRPKARSNFDESMTKGRLNTLEGLKALTVFFETVQWLPLKLYKSDATRSSKPAGRSSPPLGLSRPVEKWTTHAG